MQLGVETNFDSDIRVVEEAWLQGNMHPSIFHLHGSMFQDGKWMFCVFV